MKYLPHLALGLLLLFMPGITGSGIAASPSPATISATAYRAQLQHAAAALSKMEHSASRPLLNVLQGLSKTQTVRRADGAQLTANDDEWKRRAADTPGGNATRKAVHQMHEVVELRLRALDEWRDPQSPTGHYQPQDAQTIMHQLEATGQIRTGPTRMQQITSSIIKGFTQLMRRLITWLTSLFPRANVSTPSVDPRIIWFLFYTTVLALLTTVGYFVWRAIGRRWGRAGAQREVRFLEGEDAELLRLPPDELKERARQLAREGNFREALRHLYISLLLRLDARGVWHYDTRRTNWEHIAALQKNSNSVPLVQPLSDLTRRFDRVRYGNALCTQDEWTRFAADVETVEGDVAVGTPSSMSGNLAGAQS